MLCGGYFLSTLTDSNHPNGIDNPNQFFVFAFDAATLPSLKAEAHDADDDNQDDD